MTSSTDSPVLVLPLGYENRELTPRRRSPVVAAVLCLPGVCCWCGLALALAGIALRLPSMFTRWLAGVWFCWPVAIVCANASLVIYCRRPRPWFVWLNLAINV